MAVAKHVHRQLSAVHGTAHAVEHVGGRISWHELQLVKRRARGGRRRSRPRDVVVEADRYARHSQEPRAIDVELRRNRQVDLVKAQLTFPGEVRVGEEHAVSVLRAIAPDAPTVARGLDLVGPLDQEREVVDRRIARRLTRRGCRRTRRLGARDRPEHDPFEADERHVYPAREHVDLVDRSDPLFVAARARPLRRGRVGEIRVVPRHEARE